MPTVERNTTITIAKEELIKLLTMGIDSTYSDVRDVILNADQHNISMFYSIMDDKLTIDVLPRNNIVNKNCGHCSAPYGYNPDNETARYLALGFCSAACYEDSISEREPRNVFPDSDD